MAPPPPPTSARRRETPMITATTVSTESVSESPDGCTGSQMVASAERQSFSRERDELVLPIRDAGHVVLERDAGLDDLGRRDARQRRASGRDTPSTRFAR